MDPHGPVPRISLVRRTASPVRGRLAAAAIAALGLLTAVSASAGPGSIASDDAVSRGGRPHAKPAAASRLPDLTGAWHPIVPQPIPTPGADAESTSARCSDRAGTWLGMRWRESVRWRINRASIPEYLGEPAAVTDAIRSAATTVSTGRNDCGLAEDLGMHQHFDGATGRVAGITDDGRCSSRDGHSVVSFGRLRPGTLAVTCVWWYPGKDGGRSVEADILVDAAGGAFFLDAPPGCIGQWDLESTLTHEFGHVFGLGHVPYAEHGELTMSDGLPDCSTAYRGLGLGDYLALLARYGTR
jgi:hypothetical protein